MWLREREGKKKDDNDKEKGLLCQSQDTLISC